jgi:cyanophycin synthetase
MPYKYRTILLNVAGDRRDEDIVEFGKIAAEAFDRIVIRKGHYLRGRSEESVYALLQEGIAQSENSPQVRIIADSLDAIRHAIKNGRKGELVVTLADRVPEDIAILDEIRDKIMAEKAAE